MDKVKIFVNGPIYTVDKNDTVAEALVTVGNKIAYVGSKDEAMKYKTDAAEIVDLTGKSLAPGFIDSHIHLGLIAVNSLSADCRGAKSVADVIAIMKEQVKSVPKGEWVRGWGINEMKLAEKRMPTCEELDEVTTEHPLMISRACYHVSVNNTMALRMGGITDDTPSPEGGLIEKKDGKLTGTLKETAHNNLLKIALPSEEVLANALAGAADGLLKQGITSMHVAGAYGYVQMKAMRTAVLEGKIKNRIYAILFSFIENDKLVDDYIRCGFVTGFGDEHFRVGPVKLMIDGSTSAPTAAMLEAYDSRPGDTGILCYTPQQVEDTMLKAHKAGFQVTVHAVGDRAVTVMTTALEKALKAYPREDHRHRIEHCGFVNEELIKKVKDLNVIPVPQPAFFYEFGDGYVINYGKRIDYMFPCRTWFDEGVVAAGSSDCPVTYSDPIFGMFMAVNRVTISGQKVSQGQRITVKEALRMYTANGAYASFEEDIKGTLEAGKLADMVVLSGPLYDTPDEKIRDLMVERTIVDGEDVYVK